jgi:hypothetical protein
VAVSTLGTTSQTALSAVTFNPPQGVGVSAASSLLSPADLAAIANAITGDRHFAATNPAAILATGMTHSSTTLDTLVATGGGPLSSIQIGALVLGAGIPPGTFVIAKPTSTSVTLSQAASASASGIRIGIINPGGQNSRFNFNGQLEIPGRGMLMVKPGDVVAVDNTGWPILVSAAAIAYAGTLWSLS